MRHDLYLDLYNKEQDYWWHVGKRAIVYSLLARVLRRSRGPIRSLDVGCGTGHNLDSLAEYGDVVGTDFYEDALFFCRRRGHKQLCKADAAALPFDDRSFHLITALDVVEHLDDDGLALREMRRVLRPGGLVVISVPAYKFLWSYWDDILRHRRRYTVGSLRKVVMDSDLEVVKISYSNCLTLFPAVLVRIAKALRQNKHVQWPKGVREPETDFMPVPHFVNRLLIAYYRQEARLLKRANLPFGLSVVCVARRAGDDRS